MNRHLLLLTISAVLTTPLLAVPGPDAAPMGGAPHPLFTPEEVTELQQARAKVLQDNPSLAAEADKIKGEMMAFQQKINAAMVKVDPNVGPLLAKIPRPPSGGSVPPPVAKPAVK